MAHLCFVAGDPSGDAHAARLIAELRRRDPTLRVSGLGGPAMRSAGMTLLQDLTAAAAIGPFDAAKHLGRFANAKRLLDAHLRDTHPDLVVLVDFGDFNLPVIAPLVKSYQIPITYYISPQLWAWGRWRLRWVKRYIDRMLVFFPFEERFYQEAGVPVTWVGHPLMDEASPTLPKDQALTAFGLNAWRRTVGLLPGSREKEIERHLPVFLKAAERIAWRMPGVQFLLPLAPGVDEQVVKARVAQARCEVHVVRPPTIYDALQLMDAAIVSSGTATLQTALAGVPMAVVYKTSWLTYCAAKAVVRIPDIALVNVVAGKRIVPELVQSRATGKRIGDTLVDLLRNDAHAAAMRQEFENVRVLLGPPGAVTRAADALETTLAQGPMQNA